MYRKIKLSIEIVQKQLACSLYLIYAQLEIMTFSFYKQPGSKQSYHNILFLSTLY